MKQRELKTVAVFVAAAVTPYLIALVLAWASN